MNPQILQAQTTIELLVTCQLVHQLDIWIENNSYSSTDTSSIKAENCETLVLISPI